MATTKTEAQKVAELRKQAMDKSLPQEVRDMADKKANEIEGRSVEKATGMKLANGGFVAKPGSPRIVARQMPRDQRANAAAAGKPYSMMSAGKEQSKMAAAQKMFDAGPQGQGKKASPASPMPMMAKGGAVKKDAPKKMMYGGAVVAKAPAKELPMRGQRTATNMAKGGAVKKAKK